VSQRIVIDPVTRLEGHGRIDILLDDAGAVDAAYFSIPEFRGFEKFCEGRQVEQMPTLTEKICGVCPMAHHMAATKALDAVYAVTPPSAAKKIRELAYCTFMAEDHLLHFYVLGGPDFIVGPDAPKAERNVLGVIAKAGLETGRAVIGIRKKLRALVGAIAGNALFPVFGLPGGVSKPLSKADVEMAKTVGREAVEFAQFSLKLFDQIVLANQAYLDLIQGDTYHLRTHYMGMVDDKGQVNFYDGTLRIVDPDGKPWGEFQGEDYAKVLAETGLTYSYAKMLYLKSIGFKGLVEGADNGIYRVAPLARLNVATGMATPLAQAEYERMYSILGGKPVHHTLAYHWARLIEVLYACERLVELANDPEILDSHVRTLPTALPSEGVGVCEAPRGTLIHHYHTDGNGIVTKVNLLVATQNNAAAINLSVTKAARSLIRKGERVTDGLLNKIEMAFRAYDPCFACTTHSLPGEMPLVARIIGPDGAIREELRRG
jgi:F420-non-reducing hydrogenase large subunit